MSDIEKASFPKPPNGTRVLRNGAGMSIETGKITHAPGTFGHNPNAITGMNAREMRALAVQKRRKAVLKAIANGKSVSAGLYDIALAQVELATNKKYARYSTRAADWLMKYAGLLDDHAQTDEKTGISASPEGLQALKDVLSQAVELGKVLPRQD